MKTIKFTEFRKNASYLLSNVEEGEVIIVLRHGKPIAQISSPDSEGNKIPSWKMPGIRLAVSGEGLSKAILEERDHA